MKHLSITELLSKSQLIAFLVTFVLLASTGANAQVDSATLDELRAQIAALSNRIEELERSDELISETVISNQSVFEASSETERFEISGDIRPRFENIDNDLTPSDRNRNRVRARMAVEATLNDSWSATLGIASGGADPISTNQTLGSGGSTKDLRMDLAYVSYNGFADTELSAGKYKNVFYKPGGQNMIFDGDYRPEGVSLAWERENLFVNAGSMILESDDRFQDQDKETLWGLQLGYEFPLRDGSLTVGSSYYEAAVAGSRPFFLEIPYGNTVDESGLLVNDYEEVELFAQADFELAGRPLRFYADYVNNLDADEYDTGWALGAKYGSASGVGKWEIGYGYQDLEADAILGSLTDSDFAGGGTDNEGHILRAGYGLGNSTKIGVSYLITEYGQARLGEKVDYSRVQLDIVLGF